MASSSVGCNRTMQGRPTDSCEVTSRPLPDRITERLSSFADGPPGIINAGTLVVSRSHLSQMGSSENGAVIRNSGDLALLQSTLSQITQGNRNHGVIAFLPGSRGWIDGCTLLGGEGTFNTPASLLLIDAPRAVDIRNTTITRNELDNGAIQIVEVPTEPLRIFNTIR